jgi:hypothetical protein
MNCLLFGLEILLIVAAIGLVPARSELRICRSRVIYNEPGHVNPSALLAAWNDRCANRHGFVK